MSSRAEISRIVALVRSAGADGITAGEIAGATGMGLEAVQKALSLQLEAKTMESAPDWRGEVYRGECYRMRESN